jgi:hypothetical protein
MAQQAYLLSMLGQLFTPVTMEHNNGFLLVIQISDILSILLRRDFLLIGSTLKSDMHARL